MELIGRDREVAEVLDRLADHRLVTVIGPGGIGKSALARAATEAVAAEGRYPAGVHAVDLTRFDAADALDVVGAVGAALARPLGLPSVADLLAAPLEQPALVVVDHCEHVLDAAAAAIADLLEVGHSPTVLATSRSPLDLPAESVLVLAPLRLPVPGVDDDTDAVRLFRARARDAGADLTPASRQVVAELCRALDGVPLALELAATRTRTLTPAEIVARLGDLDTFSRPRFRGAPRHRSLRATIAWSYDQLAADDQAFFDRLALLAGHFSAETAHAVCAGAGDDRTTTLDRIARLLDVSLVVAEPAGTATRYRMLEALRTYGRERLVERGEWHTTWERFVDHAVDEAVGVVTAGTDRWDADILTRLLGLHDTVMLALAWCVSRDESPERSLRLLACLWGVVHQGHADQVAVVAEQVLARWPDPSTPGWADAAATAATCRYLLGQPTEAIALAEAARPHLGGSRYASCTLRRVEAQARAALGDVEGAVAVLDDATAEARRLGVVPLALEVLAMRAELAADLDARSVGGGLADVRAAQHDARAGGSDVIAVWARCVEASLLLRVDLDRAAAVSADALAQARALGYPACESVALQCLTEVALCRDDDAAAAARAEEWLEGLVGRGASSELRNVVHTVAVLAHRAGRGAWADLAATAEALPVVSLFAPPGIRQGALPPPTGQVLSRRDAVLVARAELEAIAIAIPIPIAADGVGAAPPAPAPAVFRRSGDVWEVCFAGRSVSLRASKGMDDLARLLGVPGRDLASVDLTGSTVLQGSTGEVLDAPARRQYEQRLRELQSDIDDAEADHDPVRLERAQREFDAIVEHLSAAVGRAGRNRFAPGTVERARSAVTQRIRSTIARIAAQHPDLGRHLEISITTGTYCRYQPEHPVDWQL